MNHHNLRDDELLRNLGDPTSFRLDYILNDDTDEDDISLIQHSEYYPADSLNHRFKANASSVCIMSLNAQSLRAKFDNLKIFLVLLENQGIIPDVICIQETWLSENDAVQCLNLDGYTMTGNHTFAQLMVDYRHTLKIP